MAESGAQLSPTGEATAEVIETSPRTCLSVSAFERDGRAYVWLQTFYQPTMPPFTGWLLGHQIVVPAPTIAALVPLLTQAAARAERFPAVLNGEADALT